jgi:hypothetical protein
MANCKTSGLVEVMLLVWKHLHDQQSRLIALTQLANSSVQACWYSSTIIQRHECLSCCTKIDEIPECAQRPYFRHPLLKPERNVILHVVPG